jgi:hypothetical protein
MLVNHCFVKKSIFPLRRIASKEIPRLSHKAAVFILLFFHGEFSPVFFDWQWRPENIDNSIAHWVKKVFGCGNSE